MAMSSNVLGTYTFSIRVVEGLELDNVGVANNPHDLQFAVLFVPVSLMSPEKHSIRFVPTLKRLSWRTRLMAASSLEGDNLVWKTTPNEPLPTILH